METPAIHVTGIRGLGSDEIEELQEKIEDEAPDNVDVFIEWA